MSHNVHAECYQADELRDLRRRLAEAESEVRKLRESEAPLLAMAGTAAHVSTGGSVRNTQKKAHDTAEKEIEEQTAPFVRANEKLKEGLMERMQAERDFKESRAWLKCIFEGALDAIFIVGADARFIDVNPAATRLTGYSEDELKAMSIPDLHEKGDLHAYHDYFQRIMEGEKITSEAKILRKDGMKVDTEFSNRMIMIGNTLYMYTVARDITARKQSENELRNTVARLSTLIQAIPDVIYFKDARGRNLVFNQAFQDLTGMTYSDIAGKTDDELFPREMVEICRNSDDEVFGSGKTCRFEEVFNLDDGRKMVFDSIKSPIFDLNGKVVGLIGISRDITEKKRAEEALRESEQKYRSLFEDSRDAIYLIDRDGQIIDVNRAILDLFGYTRNEMIRMNVRELYADASDTVRIIEELEQEGTVRDLEERLVKKDGEEVICLITVTHRKAEDSTITYQGIIRDITKQKAIEKQLRIQSIAMASSINGMTIIDLDGRVTYVNSSFLNLWGYENERNVVGKPVVALWRDEEKASEVSKAVSREGSWIGELTDRRKDGRPFIAQVSASMVRDEAGEPLCMMATCLDVTEKKLAEKEKKRSEQRFAEFINFLPDTTWAIDREGRVTMWNKEAEKMTGIPAEDILGKGNHEYALPFYGVRRPMLLDLVMNPGLDIKKEYKFIERERHAIIGEAVTSSLGEGPHYLWGKASPIFNNDGELVGAIESMRDITGRKNAEEERRNLEAHLQQAQRMEAMGVLAGGIAHDFNNILTALMGYAELALFNIPKGGEAFYSLDNILKAGHRARDLVSQILAFSRQTEQERRPTKLSPIIKETIKLLYASLPRTINIQQKIAGKKDMVLADPTQIHQILMNLCTNAHHAMMENGGILKIELGAIALNTPESAFYGLQPGPYVKLTVADTGCGMDQDVQKRIFEPYFTTKAKGVGTGLGLSVVHGIVRNYDGAVSVQSKKGKGTTFTTLLPSIDIGEDRESEVLEAIPRGSEKILFVDDEEALADLGNRLIGHLGYEVISMTSSVAALEAVRENPHGYDLVVTDMTMPRMTGDVLASKIIDIRADMPVILCTGFSEKISEATALQMGIRAFVEKPFTMKDMGRVIRQVLNGHPNH